MRHKKRIMSLWKATQNVCWILNQDQNNLQRCVDFSVFFDGFPSLFMPFIRDCVSLHAFCLTNDVGNLYMDKGDRDKKNGSKSEENSCRHVFAPLKAKRIEQNRWREREIERENKRKKKSSPSSHGHYVQHSHAYSAICHSGSVVCNDIVFLIQLLRLYSSTLASNLIFT